MKKVLIITYYWPPAGGPGVQRWLKFVKYLPEFNIEPIVYIPENPTYPIIDTGLVEELPKNITILKQKIREPYGFSALFSKKNTKGISAGIIPNQKKQSLIQRMLLWIRGNIFIPDARVLWVKPSVKYLSKYIEENNIETIITTGPPHSLHLIGLNLKNKLNVQWIADFRDPWTTIGYHKSLKLSAFAQKKHKKLEHTVLNTADQIMVTSPTTKLEFQNSTTKPITVITNGYDTKYEGNVILDNKFTLAHIGSLLSDRNPKILWEALQEIVVEIPEFKNHFQLKLIGKISNEIVEELKNYDLADYCNNLGYISHKEAIIEQVKSQVLLLIEINSEETKSIIPGKLFEYITSRRPIIAIGPEGSDFEEIIKQTQTGHFFDYTQKEILKQTIISHFESFLKNELQVNPIAIDKYSRRNLTQELSYLLLKL